MNDADPRDPRVNAPDPASAAPAPPAGAAKEKKELRVVSVPHEDEAMAGEMAELFEEDQVTHQHGGTEPEGD